MIFADDTVIFNLHNYILKVMIGKTLNCLKENVSGGPEEWPLWFGNLWIVVFVLFFVQLRVSAAKQTHGSRSESINNCNVKIVPATICSFSQKFLLFDKMI